MTGGRWFKKNTLVEAIRVKTPQNFDHGHRPSPGSAWSEYDASASYLLGDQYEALGLSQFGQVGAGSSVLFSSNRRSI